MEDDYEQATKELAEAAQRALGWVPHRTANVAGSDNPIYIRLRDALKKFWEEDGKRNLQRRTDTAIGL